MKNYTIKDGDTLDGIALKLFGSKESASKILSANNIADPSNLKAGSLLVIPGIKTSNPSKISSSSNEEVTLLIDGKLFNYWTHVNIDRTMDKIGDSFELRAPWLPENSQFKKIFKPFTYQDIAIYIGGEKLLTGTAVTVKMTANGDSQNLTVSGYSKPAILNDVTMPASAWPLEFSGLNLKQIAEQLSEPFGLTVKFLAPEGAVFTKVNLEPDKKIYPFLIDLAKQRGLVISSNVDGDMIFQKSTEDTAKSTIIEGKPPFVSSNSNYNGQSRYSSFSSLGDSWESGKGEKSIVEDDAIRKSGVLRPLVYKTKDISQGELQDDAQSKYGRSLATSIEINLTVENWRDQDGNLWLDNSKIIFKSPGIMLYSKDEYVIRQVKYIKTPVAITAELSLVFPEAYSGELRSDFPWD